MSAQLMAASTGSLSPTSRLLTRIVAVLFALLGLVMFVAPGWVSPNFLWNVSPFVAMTMGGWYLGSAYLAWEAARVWRWSSVYPCMIFLWLFSLLELGVLGVHNSRLRIDAAMGWPYLAVLVVAAAAALAGIADWARTRPVIIPEGGPVPTRIRIAIALFTVAVFIIAIFPIMGFGRGGQVFPEPLTVFTLNAFGVFYLSLMLGTLPLNWAKSIGEVLVLAKTGLALIIIITAAALVNLDKFNFAERPTQAIYLGVYLLVGILDVALFARYWLRPQADTAMELGAT